METNDSAIQVVLRRVLVLNLVVAFAKLIIGFSTGALSIVADGFHSLIDATSNLVAIVAQYIAARPPDEDHPYGHRRFEAIATFIIGGFLMLVAWEVLNAAIDRLMSREKPEVVPASFAVLIGTLVINVFVVMYEGGRGKALHSRILQADASQTGTDVIVTISVLISLVLTQAGYGWVDAVVALIIVALIGRMGWQIIAESTNALVDTAPLKSASIEEAVSHVPQIERVVKVRNRSVGNAIHVDIEAQIRPEVTTDHAHQIARAASEQVKKQFPEVKEVNITFEPRQVGEPDYALLARAAADGLGLGVHEVIAIPMNQGTVLEMHVEVTEGLSLAMAHQQVTLLEKNLMQNPRILSVTTHIEPQTGHGAALTHSQKALELREKVIQLAAELYPEAGWHEAHIRLAMGGYALTMHCHLPGDMSVEEAHQIAEHVETRIRTDLPQLQRVTIHTEPMEE